MAYNGWNLLGGLRLLGDNIADLARWCNPHSYLQSINVVVTKTNQVFQVKRLVFMSNINK